MGFNGPMDKFGEFVQSSPAHQQKFLSYEQKARAMVEGQGAAQPKPETSFSQGGLITTQGFAGFPGGRTAEEGGSGVSGPAPTTPNPTTPAPTTPTSPTTHPAVPTTSPGVTATDAAINNPSSLITPTQVQEMQVSDNEMINQNSGQVQGSADVQPAQTAATSTAAAPTATAAPTVQTATTESAVRDVANSTQAAQGTVSANAQAEAATALPSANATVQGQLASLMSQFEGGNTPPWAAGAMRNANAIMAQRGLGASSMAGGAVTQAAMESAIQIAAQDAATYSQFEMQNLNNRQQARLVNAQAFLQMDLANLDNEQQTALFRSQSVIQSLFTDQAAENASRQFNASSQAQTDQFFANLRTQVEQFNSSQTNAMSQFNAGQANSVNMFNRQMNDARDQFNAQNRLIIDQSNAEWRRAVTTGNNAAINEANRLNAQAATGMTLAGYNNLMQRERDMYSFAFTAAENAAQRAHEVTLAQFQARSANRTAAGAAVGAIGAAIVQGLFS